MDELLASFNEIDDPRVNRRKLHSIQEILFLALCAVLCGVESWRGVEEFGDDREEWLKKYFAYEHGIPSHQTIGRVMSVIKPKCLVKACTQFLANLFGCNEGEIIALDGKTLRGSFDKALGQKPLHILNAWAVNSGISLGQIKVEKKENEIIAAPQILDLIDIKNATVTVDAMNTQKAFAKKIVNQKADYALPIKGNHPKLEESVQQAFDVCGSSDFKTKDYQEKITIEKGHGRIEERIYSMLNSIHIRQYEGWEGLQAIGRVERKVTKSGSVSREIQYYLLSFKDVDKFSKVVRGHWGIENQLHWVLDVTFHEDACRVRKDHAPENFSTMRKLALSMLRQEKTVKKSLRIKQAKASRLTGYLETILNASKF
jgi:predicted transposase YbfD/YdcC